MQERFGRMQNGGHPDKKSTNEESFSLSARPCLIPLLLLFPSLKRRPRSGSKREEEEEEKKQASRKKKLDKKERNTELVERRGVALVQILVQD